MRRVLMGALSAGALVIGCGWTPPPESIPTYRVDLLASEVTVEGEGANEEAATNIRAQIAGALQTIVSDRDDFSPRTPAARFRAHVAYSGSIWPTAACALGTLILFGCPVARVTRTVDLTLEVEGEIYEGHGDAAGAAGFYYNTSGESTTASAVEAALQDALEKRGAAVARRRSGGAL
ncbi:MAG: hypothetical protein R3B72_44640 [Polyangiaceae bacterium]